jgi:hypothetical protein
VDACRGAGWEDRRLGEFVDLDEGVAGGGVAAGDDGGVGAGFEREDEGGVEAVGGEGGGAGLGDGGGDGGVVGPVVVFGEDGAVGGVDAEDGVGEDAGDAEAGEHRAAGLDEDAFGIEAIDHEPGDHDVIAGADAAACGEGDERGRH